jgi:hypothetical protein
MKLLNLEKARLGQSLYNRLRDFVFTDLSDPKVQLYSYVTFGIYAVGQRNNHALAEKYFGGLSDRGPGSWMEIFHE